MRSEAVKGDLDADLIPPTVPEARKPVLAMAAPEGRRHFLLGWSAWRWAHQAVAARCKKASRAAKRTARRALHERESPEDSSGLESTTLTPEGAAPTDAEWEVLEPILPPQRYTGGRPYHDHRTVLGGILWVARTGSSWREMPREFGKWETAYRRYELWVNQGLWPRILQALGEQTLPGPAKKKPN